MGPEEAGQPGDPSVDGVVDSVTVSKTPSTSSSQFSGKRVGHYEVIDLIGQGSIAMVFSAQDIQENRLVALKVLRKRSTPERTQAAIKLFVREARAHQGLDHPHIAKLYEYAEIAGTHFMAIELLEGGSLKDMVRRSGPLDYKLACRFCMEMADALAYMHAAQVIHSDVKPANFVLNRDGICKLADFGLARKEGTVSRQVKYSRANVPIIERVGTPQFMAAEICNGSEPSPASDIYSLGISLWYLLTAQYPFDGESKAEILFKTCEEPLPDIRTLRRDLPDALIKAIAKSMEKKPANRYPDAKQFAESLKPFAQTE